MVEQRPQTRFFRGSKNGEAHDGGSESGPHHRIRLLSSPKPR
jgi:hypothetical protein